MKKTEITSILPYLKGAIPIGVGTTAICFLMPNKNVLKLYIELEGKINLFKYFDMNRHIEELNMICNDTYIGPQEVLIKNNQVVGYIYPYVYARVLKRLSDKVEEEDILKGYKKLYTDTYLISKQNFKLFDLHLKNMLYNGNYYVIDLDKGKIENQDNIFHYNIKEINKKIINSIFDLGMFDYVEFFDDDLEELFNQFDNYFAFKELIEKMFYGGLTKREVKQNCKINVIRKNPHYYHRYF